MNLNEALQFINSLGYKIKKPERIGFFKKSYYIIAEHGGKKYRFMLDKGKLHKEIPLKSGNSFWAELGWRKSDEQLRKGSGWSLFGI